MKYLPANNREVNKNINQSFVWLCDFILEFKPQQNSEWNILQNLYNNFHFRLERTTGNS